MKQGTIYLISILFICSCTHDPIKPIEQVKICNTPDTVSFKKILIPLFNQNCSIYGCHSGGTPAGNFNLDSSVAYNSLMNTTNGYVDTINPKNSLIYAQMNSAYTPMPPTGKLDKCKIELVLKWIQQKAKNN